MKVLFQYYNGGGGALENIFILLSRLAANNPGDEYIIVCNSTSKLNKLGLISNVRIVTPKEYFHKEITRLHLGFFGLKAIVKEIQPDIVWSMNLGSYVGIEAVNMLSVNNSHQVYPLKETKSHPNNRFHVLLMRFFFRLSLHHSNHVLTQTDVVKGYVKKIAPDKPISVFTKVVENESDVHFSPLPKNVHEKLNSIENSFSMLYVATNYQHKNHQVIIEALALLIKDGCNVSLILSLSEEEAIVIAGSVAENLISLGRLCCVGWVDKSWLKHLYDYSTICLMPSTLESLSSAHLEAMAWGVPQITSNLSFAKETCKDAALYSTPHDPNSWFENIKDLMGNTELYKSLQVKGRIRICEFPSDWSEVANDYRDLFIKELNKKV